MTDDQQDSRISLALWVYMGVAVGIVLILLAAIVLGSLPLSILFAFLLALLVLAVWQRQKVAGFTTWLVTHPNTHTTLKTSGRVARRAFSFVFSVLSFVVASLPKIIGGVFGGMRWTATVLFQRKPRRPSTTSDGPELERWKRAKSYDIRRSHDPCTKYCLANIGTYVEIIYRGQPREIKTFDIYEIRVPKKKR